MQLKPGGDTPENFLKAQFLLKMAFAHVQMMLYRPFLHYISLPKNKDYDERPYASAAACVNVSRKIVHTADEMKKRGILNGAYWFTIYTTFFSVITLLYYVLENPADVTSLAILSDAETGRALLLSLKDRSLAAERCSMALAPLFEKLPENIKPDLEKANLVKKKRARAGSKSGEVDPDQSGDWSNPSRTVSPEASEPHPPNRRSKTFPGTPEADARRQLTSVQLQRTATLDQTSDDLSRKNSYGVYPTSELTSTNTTPGSQQPLPFQTHLSGSGLPDLNALMFPSPDPFNYNYAHPLSQQQQYLKQERVRQEEVQLFSPLPPYLLQGQTEPISAEGAAGVSERPNIQPLGAGGNNRAMPNSMPEQSFISGNAAGAMNLDSFFGDEYEWEQMLLQQPPFRQHQDVKEQF
jgi:hypothetical protein